jgi:hypothetical protein
MEQTIAIGNQTIHFRFMEHTECWYTKTTLDNTEVEIEIDPRVYNGPESGWTRFQDFFVFINKEGRLRQLIEDSKALVSELGKAFFRESRKEVADYKMEFSHSILYNGKTDGNFIQDGHSWSLVFDYLTRGEKTIRGDEYGLYLVDVENHFIVGAKRRQC